MLNQYLQDELEELESSEEIEKQSFKIDDKEKALWALRKLKALQSKVEEVNSIAQSEIERIQKWQQSQIRSNQDTISYFESLLIQYYKENKAKNEKFTFTSPYGKITQRKQQPKYVYQDEEVILKSLKELNHTDCIKIKETLDKDSLKSKFKVIDGTLVDEDGCIIEGVEVMEQDVKIGIKLI